MGTLRTTILIDTLDHGIRGGDMAKVPHITVAPSNALLTQAVMTPAPTA